MYDACCTQEESDWFMFHGSQEGRETHPPGILLENSKKNAETYSLDLLVQKFYTDVQMYRRFDFAQVNQVKTEQYN